jgi:hypothetical protein
MLESSNYSFYHGLNCSFFHAHASVCRGSTAGRAAVDAGAAAGGAAACRAAAEDAIATFLAAVAAGGAAVGSETAAGMAATEGERALARDRTLLVATHGDPRTGWALAAQFGAHAQRISTGEAKALVASVASKTGPVRGACDITTLVLRWEAHSSLTKSRKQRGGSCFHVVCLSLLNHQAGGDLICAADSTILRLHLHSARLFWVD